MALESAVEVLPSVATDTDGKWLGKVRELRAGDIRLGLGSGLGVGNEMNGDNENEEMNVDSSL